MIKRKFVARSGEELKSRAELKWDKEGEHVIETVFGQGVVWSAYEPFKLHIGNTWYRVDFGHQLDNGNMVLVEVKESPFQPNIRDSITRVLVSSGLFPMFEWVIAFVIPAKRGGGWAVRRMEDGTWSDQAPIQPMDNKGDMK